MKVNWDKIFREIKYFFEDIFVKRETIVLTVCSESHQLLRSDGLCPNSIERRYYKEPRVDRGEPEAPVVECVIHAPVPVEYVDVKICKDSGKVAKKVCTSVETKTFVKGSEPTEVCSLSHEIIVDPVYPPKCKKRVIVFVPDLKFVKGDRKKFLHKCRMLGVHEVRDFAIQSWGTIYNIHPFLQAEYAGKKVWLQNTKEKWESPVWNMKIENGNFKYLNPYYVAAVDKLLDELEYYDLGYLNSIGDNCSMRGDGTMAARAMKHRYPFMGSLQCSSPSEDIQWWVPSGAKNHPDYEYSPGGYHSTYRYKYHQMWVKTVLSLLRKHEKLSFNVEVENEFSIFEWKPGDKQPKNWYKMMVDTLIGEECKIPKKSIVHSCVKDCVDIVKPYLGIYCQHGIVLPDPDLKYVTKEMVPVTILSGDGGTKGNTTIDVDAKGRRGLGVEDAPKLAQFIVSKGLIGYEHMCHRLYKENDDQGNVDLMYWEPLEALIKEFNK